MNINWLEWLGYLASTIILISLLMSSIKRLRWINLVGACAFSIYGFLLGSLPVGLMNLGIVIINVYYLLQMRRSKEYFKILHIDNKSDYLTNFLEFYNADIEKFIGPYQDNIADAVIRLFILRNMVVAGVLICSKYSEDTLKIEIDFVTPQYRDFRIGSFVYDHEKEYFIDKGYVKFICFSKNSAHVDYLKKMGFIKQVNSLDCYIKELVSTK